MTVDLEHVLQRVVREDQDAELPLGSVHRRVRRRRRRRTALWGCAATAVVVVGLGAVQLSATGDDDVVAVDDRAEPVVVTATGLDGRSVTISLPEALGRNFEVWELNAGLTLEDQGWRVTATRSSYLSDLPSEMCDEPGQTAVGARLGSWTVEISGDGFTPTSCQALLTELDAIELRDGIPRYLGDGSLGPIDGPDVAAVTDVVRLSLFRRPCSMPNADKSTAAGLTVSRVDDPARQATLTVLCDDTLTLELWIEAPTFPSMPLLDRIEIRAR